MEIKEVQLKELWAEWQDNCGLSIDSFKKRYLLFFSFIFISWRLITLQYCSGFCHTLIWISQLLPKFLFFNIYLFNFWLPWILVATHGISVVVLGLCSCGMQVTAYGILVLWPGTEPVSPAFEGRFLTTGPPRKPPKFLFKLSSLLKTLNLKVKNDQLQIIYWRMITWCSTSKDLGPTYKYLWAITPICLI